MAQISMDKGGRLMNVTIRYVGTDFWGRAVFQGDNGRFYPARRKASPFRAGI